MIQLLIVHTLQDYILIFLNEIIHFHGNTILNLGGNIGMLMG